MKNKIVICRGCGKKDLIPNMIAHEVYDSEEGEEFLAENLIEEETEYSCRPCGEKYWKESKDRLKKILQNQKPGIS